MGDNETVGLLMIFHIGPAEAALVNRHWFSARRTVLLQFPPPTPSLPAIAEATL